MKRAHYLFPLMAFTALSLTLAGCDDNKAEDTAANDAATTQTEIAPAPAATAEPAAVATPVTATNAYAYATAEGATTGAIFVTLTNPAATPDKLTAVRTEKSPRAELHESFVDEADGTMQMRMVQGIDVAPGAPVELKPGGYHIMLLDLAEPLVEGQTFEATLTFQNAGDVSVPVSITAPGSSATDTMGAEMTAPAHNHDHSQHDSGEDASSTTTDTSVTTTPADGATPVDEATPDPTVESVPSDEPVTDVPAAQ
jgi:periplasmic copper chaperone A